MPPFDIVRRSFVEGQGTLDEQTDYAARELSLNVRSWSSYCFFMQDADADGIMSAIRLRFKNTLVSAITCHRPAGAWVPGPRYQLEAVISEIGIGGLRLVR